MQHFQYPGLKPILALTKPPTVISDIIGESTYRIQMTATDQVAGNTSAEQDSVHQQTHINKLEGAQRVHISAK